MRLCQGPLCDNAADVWWHGPWCGACADERFGRVPAEMFKLATREVARPGVRPQGREKGSLALPLCFDEPNPAPFYTDELVALLERRGWDELDLELALIAALDEP